MSRKLFNFVLVSLICCVDNAVFTCDVQASTQGTYYTDSDLDNGLANGLMYTQTQPVDWICFQNVSNGYCPPKLLSSGDGCPGCPSPPSSAVSYKKFEYVNNLGQINILAHTNVRVFDEWAGTESIVRNFNLIICYDSSGNAVAQCIESGSMHTVKNYSCPPCSL